MIVHKTLGFKQTKWISPMNTIELFRYSPTMGSILGNLMFNELKHCFTIQGTIATTTINDAQEERLAIAKVTDLAISIVCMKCPVLFQCIRSIYIDKSNLKFISAIQISNHLQCETKTSSACCMFLCQRNQRYPCRAFPLFPLFITSAVADIWGTCAERNPQRNHWGTLDLKMGDPLLWRFF